MNGTLLKVKNNNEFILFDLEGRILGITENISNIIFNGI